ncbi:cytochrome b561 [Dickeya sp. CFBP 2040]|uniref:cytochrome b561 n=1 Tax=Dickeya sp. CFBP 2040 TaxID=2718531 RepID=UPI001444CDF1|nr:cytochrome b561 [Dickeya sp. CFBP 2040]NKI74240.1 cytochrome b561 [Dickeya sp. CFBP 2040]
MKTRYHSSQIVLHWLALVLVVATYAAMELRGFAPRGSNARLLMSTIHYSCGVSVWVLMVLRMVQRFRYPTPPISPQPDRLIVIISHAVHGFLYLIFLALPVLGVLGMYYRGADWSVFGIAMPIAAEPDDDIRHTLLSIHELIANAGYFLVGLHAVAALYHHYVVRDNTLLRMMPGKK